MLVPVIKSISYEHSRASKGGGLGDHDPDVINVIFDVVYEGVNDNGDRFTEAEMRRAFHTMKNKPINWEHQEPNIGVITETWLEEATAAEPLHMTAKGTIWAWEYPEYADLLIASAQLGEMGFHEASQYGPSMEVYFKDADYVIGDYEKVVPMSPSSDEIFASRVGALYDGKPVSRELKQILFSGVGMTATPAEKKVKFLAVATNRSRMNGTEIFKQLEDTQFALPALRMFPIDKKEHVEASVAYFNKVAPTLSQDAQPAQIEEAYERLKAVANKFELHMPEIINLSTVSESPSNDRTSMGEQQDCLDIESEKEEREDTMEDTKVVADEVTPDEETAVEETEEVAEETVVEETVEESTDEAAEETAEEETAEEVVEEETEDALEETEASSEESFNLESAITTIRGLLDRIQPVTAELDETEASEDEADEVTALKARVTDLEASLESAEQKREAAEASLIGFKRLVELEQAGISVDDSSKEARIQSLASMNDETWAIYLQDVQKSNDEAPANLSIASLIFSDDEDEETASEGEQLTSYKQKTRAFWQKG